MLVEHGSGGSAFRGGAEVVDFIFDDKASTCIYVGALKLLCVMYRETKRTSAPELTID